MGKKTKRRQSRPKKKKHATIQKKSMSSLKRAYKSLGTKMLEMLKDKDKLNESIQDHIGSIESFFKRYDTIQLLGSIGLYLIDNLPNMEKYFMASIAGKKMELDEDAEVIAEYALNFGLSMPNDDKEKPTEEVVAELRERLRALYNIYLKSATIIQYTIKGRFMSR